MRSVGLKALKNKLREAIRRAAGGDRFDPGGVATNGAGLLAIDITRTSPGSCDVAAFHVMIGTLVATPSITHGRCSLSP